MSRKPRKDQHTVLLANPGTDLYGSDRMALETTRVLIASGVRVVVTVPQEGPLVALLKDAGAEVVVCSTPILRRGLLSPRGLIDLGFTVIKSIVPNLRVLVRSGAATVIVNTVTPSLWLPLSRLSGRRTVCHVHEGESTAPRFLRWALYAPLVFTNRIIANSAFTLSVITGVLPKAGLKTRVIYNAVSPPTGITTPREHLGNTVRLVYVGRLSHRKGPHVVVSALKLLRDEGRDATLVLVGAVFPGNEAYEEELRALIARLGLDDHVAFLGFQPSPWAAFSAADVAVVPSLQDETFGLTAVEATLAARPVIVSEVGGLPEACAYSTSSVQVPPGDPEALARAISSVVRGWRDFAARAVTDSERVAEVFSEKSYAAAISGAVFASPKAPGKRS